MKRDTGVCVCVYISKIGAYLKKQMWNCINVSFTRSWIVSLVLGKLSAIPASWLGIGKPPLKTYSSDKLVKIYLYSVSGVLTLNLLGVLLKANIP